MHVDGLADPLLADYVSVPVLLSRCAELERAGREDEAWERLSAGLAEHVCKRDPGSLPPLLRAATSLLASRIGKDGVAVGGSLAAEAAGLAKGEMTASIASGVALLLYMGGAPDAALETFTFILESFREGPIDRDICAAFAGRQNALFALDRFDECVRACDDAIAELSHADAPEAEHVRQEAWAIRELAAAQLRGSG